MNYFESLEDFGFSVEKALASHANIDIEEAKNISKSMTISDYMALVAALDVDNEVEVTKVVDKYLNNENEIQEGFHFFESEPSFSELDKLHESFFNFIKTASIKTVSESTIFSKYDISNTNMLETYVPSIISEALKVTEQLGFDEIYKAVKPFVNESDSFNKVRDVFIMKYVAENLDHNNKMAVSKITRKPLNSIKTVSYTDPKTNTKSEVVSADDKTGMIATKDSTGKISMVDTKDPNAAKQIATEEIERIKKLAGV